MSTMLRPTSSPILQMLSLVDEMDRMLTPTRGRTSGSSATSLLMPSLDAYETEQAFVVRADLPGVRSEDISVSFEQNTLTITAQRTSTPRPAESPEGAEDRTETPSRVFLNERVNGTFLRTLSLPEYVDGDAISASFENGVLTVTAPKAERAKPRQIPIGGGNEVRRIERGEGQGSR